MRINYSPNQLQLQIDDHERASWLDGRAIFYKTAKDYRPDIINPQDIEDAYHPYYMLEQLTDRNTGSEINEALDNLKKLADIYVGYADNVLGLIIKTHYGKENIK